MLLYLASQGLEHDDVFYHLKESFAWKNEFKLYEVQKNSVSIRNSL